MKTTVMDPASVKVKNILDLDQMVSDYLIFRKCDEASKSLLIKRDFISDEPSHHHKRPFVSSKILAAFDKGDYALLLSLWETYIVHFSSETLSQSLAYEVKAAEFLCNLHCAVLPFRKEVIQRVGKSNTNENRIIFAPVIGITAIFI